MKTLNSEVIDTTNGKFLVLSNDTLGQHLKRGEAWEPYFIKIAQGILRPGDYVVDVGANIGCHAVTMGHIVGSQGRVYAFEPLRIVFQQLCGNVILNGLENIYTYHLALGSGDNLPVSMIPIDYSTPDINIMNSCVGLGGEEVTIMTLDSFNLSNVSFIKIDVQGCELLVLKGSVKTIERNRPAIFIEIEEPQLKHAGTTSEEVMIQLLSAQYKLIWVKEGSLCDWIAIPVEKEELFQRTIGSIGEHEVFTV